MKRTLVILCFIAQCLNISAAPRTRVYQRIPFTLNNFSTDGCSAYPDGYPNTSENEWLHCCIAHDLSYWMGGTYDEKVLADAELSQCVSEATNEYHGPMMEFGVYIGGNPNLPTTWRWGYGWNKLISYGPLKLDQLEDVKDSIDSFLIALAGQENYLNQDQLDYLMLKFENKRNILFHGSEN